MTNSHSQRLIGTLAWDGNLQLHSHLMLPFLFLSEIVTSNIPWDCAWSYPFLESLSSVRAQGYSESSSIPYIDESSSER